MTFDRTSGLSLGCTLAVHAVLIAILGVTAVQIRPEQVPMLIEVTLAGTSAPHSLDEGVKDQGAVVAAQGEEKPQEPAMTQEEIKAWQEKRKRQLIKELASTQEGLRIGVPAAALRQRTTGLAEGRGAGEFGQPGSPGGSLSLTGAIATRGFKEPDFSVLKSLITEETQLRITLVVLPGGEVKQATLLETSGYPEVDQKAIEIARKILFDPLPADWKQVEQAGVLTIKLKF